MSDEPSNRSGADRLTIGLAVTAAGLAIAIGVVLAAGRSGGDTAALAGEQPTTTAAVTSTAPSTTTLDLTDALDGAWTLGDPPPPPQGLVSGSFAVSGQRLVVLDGQVDAGLGQPLRLGLVDSSLIYPTPTTETPSSVELQLDVELNGVLRQQRTIAVLTPAGDGLGIRFDLAIDPALFDLGGSPTSVAVDAVFVPS